MRLSACNFCPRRPKHEGYEFTIEVTGTFDPLGTRNSQLGTSSCLSVLPERQLDPQQTGRVMALHVSGVDAVGQLDRSAIGPVIYLHVGNAHRFGFFLFGFRCTLHIT